MLIKKLKLILFILSINKKEWQSVKTKQRAKGLAKYGTSLKDCKKAYNWRQMALEEVFDCSEYIDKLNNL